VTGQRQLHRGRRKSREAGLVLEWEGCFCHMDFAMVAGRSRGLEIKHPLTLVI